MSPSEIKSPSVVPHRVFESYGVTVRIEGDSPEHVEYGLNIAQTALVGNLSIIDNDFEPPDHTFFIGRNADGRFFFDSEGEFMGSPDFEIDFRRFFNTMIRVHVAEKARGWVFIHAGAVGYRGKAIILPAASHVGKTTLVGELLRAGAEYYSDEYAVLDQEGLLHAFPRDLSVRPPGSEYQVQVPPSEFGAATGGTPLSVGLVALLRYEAEAEFRPEPLTLGVGILETIPEIIPMRFNTDFSLRVLNTAFRSAIIFKSMRGEARNAAPAILSYFDKHIT